MFLVDFGFVVVMDVGFLLLFWIFYEKWNLWFFDYIFVGILGVILLVYGFILIIKIMELYIVKNKGLFFFLKEF